ncbi:MAG: hypothetical protein NT105_07285 [Verrucomicrobia bacterium]|nr:hypothetical protein [Verrucomicrobiota bacterium]
MSGADFLPATTPIFAQVSNVTATTARWAQTPAAAAVAKLRESSSAKGAGGLMTKRWSNLLDVVVGGAAQLADGEVFMALTGLQTSPRIAPQLVVGIQFGARGSQTREWVGQLKRQLKREFPATEFSDQRYFKTDYQQWRLEPGLEICVAMLGDRLILALGVAPMMEVIDRYRDSSRETLTRSGPFRAMRARLPERADWMLVAQTGPLTRALDPFLQWMPQLQTLAKPLAQLDAIGAAQVFDGNQIWDSVTVAHKVPANQPLSHFKPALLERLPASCVTCAMADVPAGEVYNFIIRTALALGHREWMKVLTLFETGWTVQQTDFAHDVLGTLGTPTAVALDWPEGQRRLAVLFGAPLQKPGHLADVMRRFNNAQQLPPLRWRVVNGWLWLSSSTESLDRISQTAQGTAPALRAGMQGQAALATNGGWWWFFADTARLTATFGISAAKQPLLTSVVRRGRFDEATAVSPLGSIVSAWLAFEATDRPPEVKK